MIVEGMRRFYPLLVLAPPFDPKLRDTFMTIESI